MDNENKLVEANSNIQASILKEVIEERVRQDAKFGPSPRGLHSSVWIAVLLEELGEVSRAILESNSDNYREELVQVAACAIAALEDYYVGYQTFNLKDVGCEVQYLPEQMKDEIDKVLN